MHDSVLPAADPAVEVETASSHRQSDASPLRPQTYERPDSHEDSGFGDGGETFIEPQEVRTDETALEMEQWRVLLSPLVSEDRASRICDVQVASETPSEASTLEEIQEHAESSRPHVFGKDDAMHEQNSSTCPVESLKQIIRSLPSNRSALAELLHQTNLLSARIAERLQETNPPWRTQLPAMPHPHVSHAKESNLNLAYSSYTPFTQPQSGRYTPFESLFEYQ